MQYTTNGRHIQVESQFSMQSGSLQVAGVYPYRGMEQPNPVYNIQEVLGVHVCTFKLSMHACMIPIIIWFARLIPRPFEERRKGLVHTVYTCSITLRILGVWILLYILVLSQIHLCVHVLQFVAGHLPFEPQ